LGKFLLPFFAVLFVCLLEKFYRLSPHSLNLLSLLKMRSHYQTSHPHTSTNNPSSLFSSPSPVPDKKNPPSTKSPRATTIQSHSKGSHHARTNSLTFTPSQHDPQPFGPLLLGGPNPSKQHRRQGSFNRYDPPVSSSSYRFSKYNNILLSFLFTVLVLTLLNPVSFLQPFVMNEKGS